eukprot:TRINITY_DN30146_c0_g1_i1.p1 TRINITY_DN30146_c0_g1~~TRINITY_DN30146_c0_g1_i1.p1  ORF type:complete len:416 (+),score=23.32 TRINITY_DN30146_c0_g1_i1:49-1296(+)
MLYWVALICCTRVTVAEESPSLRGSDAFHFPLYWEEASWLSSDWQHSTLEKQLLHAWRIAHDSLEDPPAFRYRFGSAQEPLETRLVEGHLGIIAQKALGRAKKRKPPKEITSVNASRDINAFTFCDARFSELILAFEGPPVPSEASEHVKRDASEVLIPVNGSRPTHLPAHAILSNVSPMGAFNVVIAIDLAKRLPQVLTQRSLHVAAGLSVRASHYARLTFNSLGAGASVNHLHWQGVYLRESFPIERQPKRVVATKLDMNVSEVMGWPLPTWVFSSSARAVARFVEEVFPFLQRLIDLNLAHNLLLSREEDIIRLYVIPRRLANFPDPTRTQVASTEAFGWWIIPNLEEYNSLSEHDVFHRMVSVSAWGTESLVTARKLIAGLGWDVLSKPAAGSLKERSAAEAGKVSRRLEL